MPRNKIHCEQFQRHRFGFECLESRLALTTVVRDINPGGRSSDPQQLISAGDQVFFTAIQSGTGRELWRTDGTTIGTQLVADLTPGTRSSNISGLVALHDRAYFIRDSEEVWVTDGTPDGTRSLLRASPLTNIHVAATTDRIVVTALGETSSTIWSIQGNEIIALGNFVSTPSDFVEIPQGLIFIVGQDIWMMPGNDTETILVSENVVEGPVAVFKDQLYFRGINGDLQVLDASTGAATPFAPKRDFVIPANGGAMTATKNLLFFSAVDDVYGTELWSTDGTNANTSMVLDSQPGDGDVRELSRVGDVVVFLSKNSMWRSDGTRAGTYELAEFPAVDANSRYPTGSHFFSAQDVVTHNWWISDGSEAGTWIIPSRAVSNAVFIGSDLLFGAITFDPELGESDVLGRELMTMSLERPWSGAEYFQGNTWEPKLGSARSIVVDFDDDNDFDVIVQQNSNAWLENVDGRLKPKLFPFAMEATAPIDMNGDGRLDIFYSTQGEVGWLERSDSELEYSRRHVLGHVDSNADFIDALRDPNGTLTVLLSTASGIFEYREHVGLVEQTVLNGRLFGLVDVSGDGVDDVIIQRGTDYFVSRNLGDNWDVPELIDSVTGPVAFGDFDGDGDVDFVAANNRTVQIHVNDAGHFAAGENSAELPAGVPGSSVRQLSLFDVDGDDLVDIVFSNSQSLGWFRSIPKGGFDAPEVIVSRLFAPQRAGIPGVIAGIVRDTSGRHDVLFANLYQFRFDTTTNLWTEVLFSNRSIVEFTRTGNYKGTFPHDADDDGDLDIFYQSGEWIENKGDGIFTVSDRSQLSTHVWNTYARVIGGVAVADVERDGIDTVFSASDAGLDVVRMDAEKSLFKIGGEGRGRILLGDVDSDGDDDVITFNSSLTLYRNESGSEAYLKEPLPGGATRADLGDVDGDGDLDIVAAGDRVTILQNDGNGKFTLIDDLTRAFGSPHEVLFADMDQDNDLDVVYAAQSVDWFENDGTGSFSMQHSIFDRPARSAVVWDIEGDGDLDVIVAAFFGNWLYAFENLGDSTFGPVVPLHRVSRDVESIRLADLDNDGFVDVLLESEYAPQWLRNNKQPVFVSPEVTVAPRIVNSSPDIDAVVFSGAVSISMRFDQPIHTAVLDTSDFSLVGSRSGLQAPLSWQFAVDENKLIVSFDSLPIDTYHFTLVSASDALIGATGLLLDGERSGANAVSGDGIPGGNFEIVFSTSRGDFNDDLTLNALDIDAFCAVLQSHLQDRYFDIDSDGTVDLADFVAFLAEGIGTVLGDVNLDGVFNSADLVDVFVSGEFEDNLFRNSSWQEGDWNCDGDFDSSDFVSVFQLGTYVAFAHDIRMAAPKNRAFVP